MFFFHFGSCQMQMHITMANICQRETQFFSKIHIRRGTPFRLLPLSKGTFTHENMTQSTKWKRFIFLMQKFFWWVYFQLLYNFGGYAQRSTLNAQCSMFACVVCAYLLIQEGCCCQRHWYCDMQFQTQIYCQRMSIHSLIFMDSFRNGSVCVNCMQLNGSTTMT